MRRISPIPGRFPLWTGLVLLVLILSGCGQGLPDQTLNRAKALPGLLDKTETGIQDREKDLEKTLATPEFKSLTALAQRENWAGEFPKSRETLNRARELYRGELAPLIKANHPESAQEAEALTQRIRDMAASATGIASRPLDRLQLIRETMARPEKAMAQAQREGNTLIQGVTALEAGAVAAALAEFPSSKQTIENRFAPLLKMRRQTRERLDALARAQSDFKQGRPLDPGPFVDATQDIAQDHKAFSTRGKDFETALSQLYKSYTKVLQDMKTEFMFTIKRESWNENSDYDTSRQVTFNRQVTPEIFQVMADHEGAIAAIVPGFTGMSLSTRFGSAWDRLNIDPTEHWPDRSHNAAEFWVEDATEAYFHKYLMEENGQTRETDWVKVNPSYYEQNIDNLGMAILSKPYGLFEDEQLAQAAPPGLANVGNPKYGEWKEDDNGNSFWSWYGRYAFFSHLFFYPPYYYPYGGWQGWHRNYRHKKPYYGTTKNGKRQYGTFGTQVKNSPKYRNSTFAKTGGFKSGPVGVRGAGSRTRGGGPGGKGK